MIQTALISLPSRAHEPIFGRPLLERLIGVCRRAGISRFIIEANRGEREPITAALGGFTSDASVQVVQTLQDLSREQNLEAVTPCILFTGNLVLAQSQLARAIEEYNAHPGVSLQIKSTDPEHGGTIAIGPLADLVGGSTYGDMSVSSGTGKLAVFRGALDSTGTLPFALNGRPEDRQEAEVRLARAIRHESARTDALMARILDRRLSWRLSLRLARTHITPNQITVMNTALGFSSAALFSSTSYWFRLLGALLFLLSITLDGVDGELARLRMLESRFGQRLDVITDNVVHIAIFFGIAIGCYRLSDSNVYLCVLAGLMGGFAACAVSVNRAMKVARDEAHEWISQVERATGRDFAYLVALFAILNRLSFFIWGVAFGTYIFALTLWWITNRHRRNALAPVG